MKHGLFKELKRRHVYRVAVAYAVVGWLVIQAATSMSPYLHLPDIFTTMVIAVVALGFPVAIILAWAFEVTPEGMRRTAPADSDEARAPEQHRKVGQTLNTIIIGVLVVAVALLAWRVWAPHKTTPGHPPVAAAASSGKAPAASVPAPAGTAIPAKSIAVLPFENLSEDKKNGYFADGMQDLILTKLADIGDLKVISRTSTMQYGSHPQNLTKIGQELGVATLLEGSVQKAGDQVLVNVQLIDARTDAHLWANSYQRKLENVFGVEGEVAEKIANALNSKLSPAVSKRLASGLSNNPDANVLYLRAQHALQTPDSGALKQAISLYRNAIAKAPDFALARAQLSMTESSLAYNFGGGGEDIDKLRADALAQAKQAMKLAPELPESHLAMGFYEYHDKGDFDSALEAFDAALQIRPSDAAIHRARALVLRRQGKIEQSLNAMRRAFVLDPNSIKIPFNLGTIYMGLGRYREAEQTFRNGFALHPDEPVLLDLYANCILLDTGNPGKALAELQGVQSNNPLLKSAQASLLMYQRKYASAIALLESIPSSEKTEDQSLLLGKLYYLSGDKARARKIFKDQLPKWRAQMREKTGYTAYSGSFLNTIAGMQLMLGKTREGLASIKAALVAADQTKDRLKAPHLDYLLAINYALADRPDLAVSMLSRALSTPGIGVWYSPPMLWIDPNWDPIRGTPQFQALLKKYARYQPPLEHYPAPPTSSTVS